jgi:hypothetical protein
MPLYTNTSKGTVNYQPEGHQRQLKLLANDFQSTVKLSNGTWTSSDFAIGSADFDTVPDFTIPVGPYQTIVGESRLWIDSDSTNEFIQRIITTDPSATTTTAVATTIEYSVLGLVEVSNAASVEAKLSGNADATHTDAHLKGVSSRMAAGIGSAIYAPHGASWDGESFFGMFKVYNNTSTKAELKFQMSILNGGNVANTRLVRGSHLAYSIF